MVFTFPDLDYAKIALEKAKVMSVSFQRVEDFAFKVNQWSEEEVTLGSVSKEERDTRNE